MLENSATGNPMLDSLQLHQSSMESLNSICSNGLPKVKARRKTATPEDMLFAGAPSPVDPGLKTVPEEAPKPPQRGRTPTERLPTPVRTPTGDRPSPTPRGDKSLSTRVTPTTDKPPPLRISAPSAEKNQSNKQTVGDKPPTTPRVVTPTAEKSTGPRLTPTSEKVSILRVTPIVPGGSPRSTPPPDRQSSLNGSIEEGAVLMPPPKVHPGNPRANTSSPRNSAGMSSPLMTRKSPGIDVTASPTMTRKIPPPVPPKPEPSPLLRRKVTQITQPSGGSGSNSSLSRQSSVGTIHPVGTRTVRESQPLVHSHTAEGHTKAVLSVFATEELLFSSSKDRTAKVWDLATGEEILTLDGHPNNVVSVKYSEDTRLVYTVSTYFIKVWDVREGPKCIKTLTSAGLTNDGILPVPLSSRQVTCPPGETNINDIALNSTGTVLYSAAGNTVRIWDLRSFKAVGKLSGGHQAAVMVLDVDDTDTADGNICIVTGSKDHYIKVFEVGEDSVGMLTPKYNLEPPHYDGIQSLCLMGDLLFSGSRDTCIKKWDLAEQRLEQSINNAHKDWVCGLSLLPGGNALLSGCRGGYLKLWNIDDCSPLGEIRAHNSPINAITTNSNMIFTASNECIVKLWEPEWDQLPECVHIADTDDEL